MTEFSGFWTTTGTPAGDQVSGYTQSHWADAANILSETRDENGVAAGYKNSLNATVPSANTVRVQTGGGIVDGKWYYNTANVDINIPSAVGAGNTRIDRIVLRTVWASFTVRLTRIAGVDAATPTPPAITQTPGTTYDILLWQALVNTSGTVTLTDERAFGQVPANGVATNAIDSDKIQALAVTAAKLAADAVQTAKIEDSAVTAAKIANRTRKFFFEPGEFYKNTAQFTGRNNAFPALLFDDAQNLDAGCARLMPEDYASGNLTVKMYWSSPAASGNVSLIVYLRGIAAGESANSTSYDQLVDNVFATSGADQLNITTLTTTMPISAGDVLHILFQRRGAEGDDTLSSSFFLHGLEIEYTADS